MPAAWCSVSRYVVRMYGYLSGVPSLFRSPMLYTFATGLFCTLDRRFFVGDSNGSECSGNGPSTIDAKNCPRPCGFMMKASVPLMPLNGPSFARGASGAIVGLKSGTSLPTHLFASASHQMSFFFSLQGLPEGSAEARL